MSTSKLPLAGFRVVDLSTVVFGPLASQSLVDYGAEVIKVETPEGDSTRFTGPTTEEGMAAIFLGSNRGKKSVVLDLKQHAAQQALHAVIAGADVFMHSMRPQKLASLGVDPERLLRSYPRLVYAGLHGFAEGGPYAGRPAYDDVIQGLSGAADLVRLQTGEMRYLPTIAADKTCALIAAQAILAALLKRERTGQGGFVEIPMFESMVGFNLVENMYGHHFDPPLSPPGYPRTLEPSRRPWKTSNGHICMMPYTTAHWRRFFLAAGRDDLSGDGRFGTMADRTRHIAELLTAASLCVGEKTTEEWLEICGRLEIPAAPVNRLDGLADDEHLRATGFFQSIVDPQMGKLTFPGVSVSFDGVRPPVHMPPRLGQHTEEVLTAAGLSSGELNDLEEQKAAILGRHSYSAKNATKSEGV